MRSIERRGATTQKKVVVDDLVENRSFEEYVWCIAFETLFPKARAFVCGINDEKFESFPKRRQENESHIDRSIEREEEEEKAVVLIAQSTTFERPTTSVGMCDSCYFAFTSIWVALQQIYKY